MIFSDTFIWSVIQKNFHFQKVKKTTAKIDNSTEFAMASGLVKIAVDEFYSHNPNNLTGLVQRYWMIVEDELAGNGIIFN